MSRPRCRLAPSPTGYLHIGNARTFLAVWLSARRQGAELILRMEDIDSPRVKPGYAESQMEDLRWLGLDWDAGPVYQSSRLPMYAEALERLKAAELVYPCTCSRKDIASAGGAPHAEDAEPVYPGTCSHRWAKDADLLGKPFAWRFRAERDMPFDDLFQGSRSGTQAGDFVVWRGNMPAYQLAVVVDDAAMEITEVLRGDDLLDSTPKQLALYNALDLRPPRFGHLPLVLDGNGRRMAKRNDSTRLMNLRTAGATAAKVVGILAHSLGLTSTPGPIAAGELIAGFGMDRIDARSIPIATQ